jgi:hypothetical protein
MEQNPSRNPAPAPTGPGVPATTQPAALDAHGFDPTAFTWKAVPRRPRKDGWTPDVQQDFIAALARTGVVERACEIVHRSVSSAYGLRNGPGGEGFARAWDAVLTRAADRLLDVAFELAIEGEEIPIFDQDGLRTGARRRVNTRMMMFLLRAYHPERFRHAHRDTRVPDEVLPPPAPPLPQITATLAPVTPAAPHLLAAPEEAKRIVGDAKWQAAQPEPPETVEVYRAPRVPADHPKVRERAFRARRRRVERDDADRARFDGPGDDDSA